MRRQDETRVGLALARLRARQHVPTVAPNKEIENYEKEDQRHARKGDDEPEVRAFGMEAIFCWRRLLRHV